MQMLAFSLKHCSLDKASQSMAVDFCLCADVSDIYSTFTRDISE